MKRLAVFMAVVAIAGAAFVGFWQTGAEAGTAALDSFTEWKSVYVDYSGRLQRAQIDTETILKET